jgi:hypothetical protein
VTISCVALPPAILAAWGAVANGHVDLDAAIFGRAVQHEQ